MSPKTRTYRIPYIKDFEQRFENGLYIINQIKLTDLWPRIPPQ